MASRKIKPVTEQSLREYAVEYVHTYSTTTAKLRRKMLNNLLKHREKTGETLEGAEAWVDAAIGYCVSQGYLDDARFTKRFIELAQENGQSRRKIQGKLAQRGISSEMLQEQLEATDFDDLAAAEAYARKKRIGKFRPIDRDEHKDRDLARLGRQGFSYEICRQIVEGEAEDGDRI